MSRGWNSIQNTWIDDLKDGGIIKRGTKANQSMHVERPCVDTVAYILDATFVVLYYMYAP